MFNPSCICGNGYKSTNISSEKNLIDIEDICVLCDAEEDCGVAPSASPSSAPTLSHKPSAKPTLSSKPTGRPTASMSPSGSPTTVKPTLKPTKSTSPTLIPSSTPSSFNSIFDGDPCRFDIECRTGHCDEGYCRKGVSTVTFVKYFLSHLSDHLTPSLRYLQWMLRKTTAHLSSMLVSQW